MKKLLLGNAAAARGLYEAGCSFVSSYPGTPSTEITEEAAKFPEVYAEWAPNEKCALEAALGASIAGARAMCAMKHVGLNVAADPLYTAAYTGVNGGLVIAVADDPGMHSSQNEQDSRHHAIASKVPMVEPADSGECRDFMKLAFELSEAYDTPVLFRTCTRVAHSQSLVELHDRQEAPLKEYVKNPRKYVMAPGNAIPQHVVVENRTAKLREYGEDCPFNRVEMADTKWGVITSGISYQYVKEALPEVSVLKLGLVNPLPEKIIRDFASKVEKLAVVEELDPIIETHLRNLGIRVDLGKAELGLLGEFSQNRIRAAFGRPLPESDKLEEALPVRPPVLCPGCPHRGLFHVLHKLKVTVSGDIGCYTLGASAPLSAMDSPRGGQEDGGRHRRLHLHAQRHDRPREPGVQPGRRRGADPRQLHHWHDRPSAEPSDRHDAQRAAHGPALRRKDRGGLRREAGPCRRSPGPEGHGSGHQGGAGRGRTLGHRGPAALRFAQVGEA